MTETMMERLHHIYVLNPRLAAAGISYGEVHDDPECMFRPSGPALRAERPHALLPAQARVAERLRRDEEIAAAVRGGAA